MPEENKSKLILQDHPDGHTLVLMSPDGICKERKTVSGKSYVIPLWCNNTPDDHACAWGCMGILHDMVSEKGRTYCNGCDCYSPQNDECWDIECPHPINKYEDWMGFHIAHSGIWENGMPTPTQYPCKATIHKRQTKNQYGRNDFLLTVDFVY